MPKRNDVKRVLLIGSGPIVIGQAAEFDFSGTQACRALKEEGLEVVLVNSNPATIMTDAETADAVYIEPLNSDILEKIIAKEKPDSIIAGIGGQTGLNMTTELAEKGILEKYGVKILGTQVESIKNTEDRELFKELMMGIGERVPRSKAVTTMEEVEETIDEFGLPLIIRPAYTLGGAGGGIAHTREELYEISEKGFKKSRIHQLLIEESVLGWEEIEFEVMRDKNDTCIVICTMENIDPMGIHTGESMVVAPILTMPKADIQMLRDASIRILRALNIEGGCNVQLAYNPETGDYRVIEVNPRVSRSSALASKATGFPIARATAKIAIGRTLDEIVKGVEVGSDNWEPKVEYVVAKVARWPFDKFTSADRKLTTAMKSTGEVMAIGGQVEDTLQKAIRGLDIGKHIDEYSWTDEEIEELLKNPTDERIFVMIYALKKGYSVKTIAEWTKINPFFIEKINNFVSFEKTLKEEELTKEVLIEAKKLGFTDERISELTGKSRIEITDLRLKEGIEASYRMVDPCAEALESFTPYYYTEYSVENLSKSDDREKILILGAGPIRIGQGIEFDYCTVHAVKALRDEGIETLIINNNPETVSTDYDTSDKLFFEPLTLEDVMNVIEKENPTGVLVQFGGQTSVNLAIPLEEELKRRGMVTKVLGTSPESMDMAEDRERFNVLMSDLGILQPEAGYATSESQAFEIAEKIGYPVLVRPSYVLGGRAMEIVYDRDELEKYIKEAVRVTHDHPILIDDFLEGAREIDVDAVCDGKDVFIGAIMEHIEEAGVHSGDSACVIPPQTLSEEILEIVRDYTRKIALALNVKGMVNIQMAEQNGKVFVLEANPRSSRTVPFVSKAIGIPLAKIAAKVMIGKSLKDQGYIAEKEPQINHVAVKEVILPFDKLPGADPLLSPEMKSTGEVMGIDYSYDLAFYKAEMAADNTLPLEGTVFMSIRDKDKDEMLEVAKDMASAGLKLIGTTGTAKFMEENDVSMDIVLKVYEGTPNVIDRIRKNEVNLVINTPTEKTKARRDGSKIRRAAVDYGIPYITTLQSAKISGKAITAAKEKEMAIKSIQEYNKDNS
ncbi:Carbamoyl-phosphate synthase large chain [Methanimicrococcus stummii]|uniref:Carbamoyl phosphate synthase large chain n=1 Tax=Methanimicrococcus stummii TaxID=3028294 RepID=A0AA96VAA7_9EURY|nr:carbamoyl-phosphate synthase large subunit [Methanimicrococcus sp. Es2]WNY28173.1 Carbamoyl-phosphate synthase large chain [Methanimicrococcus sp. Es2]